MAYEIKKSTHGYDPQVKANPSTSVTTTGLAAGDHDRIATETSPVEVPMRPESPNPDSAPFTTLSQIGTPQARPVDFKSLAGSYQGDHRFPSRDTAKETLDRVADQGGPRKPTRQAPFGKNTPSDLAQEDCLGADNIDKG